jgi:hypothetical protein
MVNVSSYISSSFSAYDVSVSVSVSVFVFVCVLCDAFYLLS